MTKDEKLGVLMERASELLDDGDWTDPSSIARRMDDGDWTDPSSIARRMDDGDWTDPEEYDVEEV